MGEHGGVDGAGGPWVVEHVRGHAGELHAADVPVGRRLLRVHDVVAPAVVLGSAQPDDVVDVEALAAAGVEVARRRSGGGVVTLAPGGQVWVDVVVPAGDPLWDDDVCHASWWLGDAWAASLAPASPGPGAPEVRRGGVTDRAASRLACFAALGPGEVTVGGAKVVGISQRRTRHWARFQCVAYRRWDGAAVVAALAAPARTPAVVAALTRGVGRLPTGWDVVGDLVPHLPT